ncbi:toll/interleukin-1 receptor domain-containing protein [Falsiroseomonas oryzae]|uniref:toll/interleukin-1 receptor domain-containing protein n=1 Tax=Falsiroseomonas oryzae TaxID=2766473 RepID=UPI0022EB89CD|nr:toll/interleukin-1 receptor domain-containing protein [Roseomonas sp. MO-31]
MAEVFISYSSRDKLLAEDLGAELDRVGVTFWRDEIQIGWGELINKKVADGLSNCRFVTVLITANAMASHWVRKEVNFALHREAETGSNVLLPYIFCDPNDAFSVFADLKTKKYLTSDADFSHAATQVRHLIHGPVTDQVVHNFPFAYTGPVWMRLSHDDSAAMKVRCELQWGPWAREFAIALPAKKDSYLVFSKQDNLSLPLRVAVHPPCRISFGIGLAPTPSAVDINPFWVDMKSKFARFFARTFLWPR